MKRHFRRTGYHQTRPPEPVWQATTGPVPLVLCQSLFLGSLQPFWLRNAHKSDPATPVFSFDRALEPCLTTTGALPQQLTLCLLPPSTPTIRGNRRKTITRCGGALHSKAGLTLHLFPSAIYRGWTSFSQSRDRWSRPRGPKKRTPAAPARPTVAALSSNSPYRDPHALDRSQIG